MRIKRSLVTPKAACTGCTACEHRCPTKAISMQRDDEGFSYPVVDAATCIQCDLCNQVCPCEEEKPWREYREAISSQACWNANEQELKKSSSGGVFSLYAREILALGGVVCGAVYDERVRVYHDFALDEEQLERMRGSKYVQSHLGDCFIKIKQFLKDGRYVLFTGTPCQVGGLKAYLGKLKDSSLLICMDLICEGTPSPGVFQSYIEQSCRDFKRADYFSFRDKTFGWGQVFLLDYETHDGEKKKFLKKGLHDPYIAAMFGAISLRPVCYNCRFREGRSDADITIGDLWALKLLAPGVHAPLGASSVITYTAAGHAMVEATKSQLSFNKNVHALASAINNGYVYRSPKIANPELRKQFFENYQSGMPLEENFKSVAPLRRQVAILNHAGHSNHGSNLTAYALQEHLRRLGYLSQIVSLRPYREPEDENMGHFRDFCDAVLRFTPHYYGAYDCTALNEQFDTFIAGSDQIWRFPQSALRQSAFTSFFLEFAAQDKLRISYAGSFGTDQSGVSPQVCEQMKRALEDMDAISAREADAARNLKIQFSLTSDIETVVDPVFFFSARDWQRISLVSTEELPSQMLSFYYFFSRGRMQSTIQIFAHEQNLELKDLSGARDTMAWLRSIEKSTLVITDSFHALCFALIFERPFIAVSTPEHGMTRLESLLAKLGLSERLIDLSQVDDKGLLFKIQQISLREIDYSEVQLRLRSWKEQSDKWLQNALQKKPKTKSHVLEPLADKIYQERNSMRQHLRGLSKKYAKACIKSLIKRRVKEARYRFYLARKYRRLAKQIP